MSNVNQTTTYLQILAQMVMNLLTSEVFRSELMEEQEKIISGQVSNDEGIREILKNNGYSEEMASEFVIKKDKGEGYYMKLDIETLVKTNITEVMPDDVEMMTLGGFNLNW